MFSWQRRHRILGGVKTLLKEEKQGQHAREPPTHLFQLQAGGLYIKVKWLQWEWMQRMQKGSSCRNARKGRREESRTSELELDPCSTREEVAAGIEAGRVRIRQNQNVQNTLRMRVKSLKATMLDWQTIGGSSMQWMNEEDVWQWR